VLDHQVYLVNQTLEILTFVRTEKEEHYGTAKEALSSIAEVSNSQLSFVGRIRT